MKCRSCNARVIWATTSTLKAMPVDPEPSADGNVVLEHQGGGAYTARVLKKGEAHVGERHKAHFATCPQAAQHRRPA